MKAFYYAPGEIGRMYESNVDDVGYRLVAVYTPVREDGAEGQPISASTEPIGVGMYHYVILVSLYFFLNKFQCYNDIHHSRA